MGQGTCLWVSSQVVRGSPGSVKPCTEIVCAQHFFFLVGNVTIFFSKVSLTLKKNQEPRGGSVGDKEANAPSAAARVLG